MKVIFWGFVVFGLSVVTGQSLPTELLSDPEGAIKKFGGVIKILFPEFNGEFLTKFVNLAKTVKSLTSAVLSPSGARGLEPSDLQNKVRKLKKGLIDLGPYVQRLTGVDVKDTKKSKK